LLLPGQDVDREFEFVVSAKHQSLAVDGMAQQKTKPKRDQSKANAVLGFFVCVGDF
jgi:hypothetical protein